MKISLCCAAALSSPLPSRKCSLNAYEQILNDVISDAEHFDLQMPRFRLYEDYAANYELVLRDIEDIQRAIVSWSDYDKAIEVLSAHVNPTKSQEANRKKAMTLKDLLIKVSWTLMIVAPTFR